MIDPPHRHRRKRSRARLWIGVTLASVLAGGALLLSIQDAPTGVGSSLALARDPHRFDSSADAAVSFTEVASLLFDDARTCVKERGEAHPSCEARLAGIAYAQVMAVTALRCTQPDLFEARVALIDYLERTERVDADPTAALPEVPVVPRCT